MGQVGGDEGPIPRPFDVLQSCFRVQVVVANGEDAQRVVPVAMTATYFRPANISVNTTAVLLVPGGLADQTAWDGYSAGLGQDEGTTLPRRLAALGYAVFAIDRIGYPQSPAEASGLEIHPSADTEAIEQVTNQLRAGGFGVGKCGEDTPTSHGFARIVAAGFSHGSFVIIDALNRTQAQFDGAILLAFSIYPGPKEADALAILCTARHGDPVRQTAKQFCDDFTPAFPPCVDWMTEAPLRHATATAAACHDIQAADEPLGLAIGPPRGDYGARLATIQAVPVYFLNGELDRVFGHHPDAGGRGWDAMFERIHAECTCTPTTREMAGEGHMTLLHADAQPQIDEILAWMSAMGLDSNAH